MTERTLAKTHLTMLREESAISSEVIAQRGYFTAQRKAALAELGFSPAQQRTPALVIPVHSVTGGVAFHQARPDYPRRRQDKPVLGEWRDEHPQIG